MNRPMNKGYSKAPQFLLDDADKTLQAIASSGKQEVSEKLQSTIDEAAGETIEKIVQTIFSDTIKQLASDSIDDMKSTQLLEHLAKTLKQNTGRRLNQMPLAPATDKLIDQENILRQSFSNAVNHFSNELISISKK